MLTKLTVGGDEESLTNCGHAPRTKTSRYLLTYLQVRDGQITPEIEDTKKMIFSMSAMLSVRLLWKVSAKRIR